MKSSGAAALHELQPVSVHPRSALREFRKICELVSFRFVSDPGELVGGRIADRFRYADFTLLIHLRSGQAGRWPQLLTYSSLTAWTIFSQQVFLLQLHPWIGWYVR